MDLESRHFKSIDLKSKSKSKSKYPNATYGVLFIYARGMSYSYMPLYFQGGVFGFVKDVISNIYLLFKRFEDEEESVFIAGTVLNVKPFIPK